MSYRNSSSIGLIKRQLNQHFAVELIFISSLMRFRKYLSHPMITPVIRFRVSGHFISYICFRFVTSPHTEVWWKKYWFHPKNSSSYLHRNHYFRCAKYLGQRIRLENCSNNLKFHQSLKSQFAECNSIHFLSIPSQIVTCITISYRNTSSHRL